jgi:S1-C subfamily serine protease
LLTVTLAGVIASSSFAAAIPPGYEKAELDFQAHLALQQRLLLQVLIIAAGYSYAVPNENFSQRLFGSIKKFQEENGFPPTGILDGPQVTRLIAVATPLLNLWGFRKATHPYRKQTIWIPFGLGLVATRNEYGLHYQDQNPRVQIDFTTVPNLDLATNFAALTSKISSEGVIIHYKVLKDGWFVISTTTPEGIDHYLRYHQDGRNVTGFSLSWNNAVGDVHGERIAVLMSASLWSNMTGAPLIEPPAFNVPPKPAPSQEVVAKPEPTKPAPRERFSAGTGFFVAQDGAFVTNAHVVEGCSDIKVKSDDGSVTEGHVMATDTANDLALLKLSKTPSKIAALRIGVRLGEGVEAFGFPHSGLLSSSGNFTLGNVTALNGIGDDSRFLQISAPVQAGNSGGPLLDQSGNLIGVVTSKLNALKVALNDGDLPQNVNFAVKTAILAAFLDSNRVQVQMGSVAAKPMEPADIADQARAISGFVVCK